MTDLLLTFGANNLLLSLALALVAFGVQRLGKRPLVARLLWLLVLAKLVTPSLFAVPVVAIPGLSSATAQTLQVSGPSDATALSEGIEGDALSLPEGSSDLLATASSLEPWKQALALLWLLGSAAVLVGSLVRVLRFQSLKNLASESAPPELQDLAAEIATPLGLRKVPTICTTSAHLLPMVWWVGGPVRVFVPGSLVRTLDPRELRFILAHELAHVRRRDHLVRWLEWLACVLCWWNPVAWWARRSLRTNEEVCCDALVLATLKPNPRSYATSLLNVVEFLASPALRPPAMASAIHDGGFLEGIRNFVAYGVGMAGVVMFLTLGMALGKDAIVHRLRQASRVFNKVSGVILVLAGTFVVFYWSLLLASGDDALSDNALTVWVEGLQSDLTAQFSKVPELLWIPILGIPIFAALLYALRGGSNGNGSPAAPQKQPEGSTV